MTTINPNRKPKKLTLKHLNLLAIIIFIIAHSNSAFAQTWTPGAASAPEITTQGKVGVGTTVPDAKVDVATCTPTESVIVATKMDCTNPNQIFAGTNPYDAGIATGVGVDIYTTDGSGGNYTPVSIVVSPQYMSYILPNTVNLGITSTALFAHHYGTGGGLGTAPLFWGRTQSNGGLGNSGPKQTTRFIVLPNGYTGINNATPRVELDVLKSSYYGPAAIFGVKAIGTAIPTLKTGQEQAAPPTGVNAFHTKQIAIVPNLRMFDYNKISQAGDLGIIFTDGIGTGSSTSGDIEGCNAQAGLIIAPFAANSARSGGIRIAANGDIDLAGDVKATKITVNAKWWPDFVFQPNYQLMPLEQVGEYIAKNHHLPGFKADTTMISEGNNIGETQALQQQKIEELTLYTIQQQNLLKAQAAEIAAQATAMAAQIKKQAALEILVQQLLAK